MASITSISRRFSRMAKRAEQSDVVELSNQAIAALLQREMLFVQAGRLVDVDVANDKVTVDQVKRPRLLYHMRRCLDWHPRQLGLVASDLLEHKKLEGFRRLEGTYTAPTFRPDFSLIPPG